MLNPHIAPSIFIVVVHLQISSDKISDYIMERKQYKIQSSCRVLHLNKSSPCKPKKHEICWSIHRLTKDVGAGLSKKNTLQPSLHKVLRIHEDVITNQMQWSEDHLYTMVNVNYNSTSTNSLLLKYFKSNLDMFTMNWKFCICKGKYNVVLLFN